jgi:hypothetical protein
MAELRSTKIEYERKKLGKDKKLRLLAGLPDGIFSNQKSRLW